MAMGAGSTAVGASCGAATVSRGVVSTTSASPSATVVAFSGATDSLATKSPESTQSVETATVATTILMDQAEEGDEAWHLTGGSIYIPWRDATILKRCIGSRRTGERRRLRRTQASVWVQPLVRWTKRDFP
ncbi:uncharacterized protein LOC125523729 [Triticum urartu]|uniref:uncharacterized protein LOC125523506 n=1 Tax=Triticum urartu TaxID=4572 RepID=UPI00204321EC|nr:uncharacterized protein LOC125523506 [Triticum urartu]XP_048544749.1 uncharacterized protein LOC125523729 [Triticum urartu]